MSKKSRRAKRNRGRATRSKPIPPVVQGTSIPSQEPLAPDFSEYRYVIADLRRVAIVAIAMFALLIALSFLIR